MGIERLSCATEVVHDEEVEDDKWNRWKLQPPWSRFPSGAEGISCLPWNEAEPRGGRRTKSVRFRQEQASHAS